MLCLVLKGVDGTANANGAVQGPLVGEMRLASDLALARDSRTACLWQLPISMVYTILLYEELASSICSR